MGEKVFVNHPRVATATRLTYRRRVTGEIVKENARSVWVRLDDGSVVKRKKRRDVATAN